MPFSEGCRERWRKRVMEIQNVKDFCIREQLHVHCTLYMHVSAFLVLS